MFDHPMRVCVWGRGGGGYKNIAEVLHCYKNIAEVLHDPTTLNI